MSKRKAMYISGGMTGYKDFNYPSFAEYQKRFTEQGFKTLNPGSDIKPMFEDGREIEIKELHAMEKAGQVNGTETWRMFLRGDIIAIMNKCDSIYMTKGWFASKGAKFELFVARQMGLDVIHERPFWLEIVPALVIMFLQKVCKITLTKPF